MRFFFFTALAAVALALAAASDSEAGRRGGRHGFRAGGCHGGQRHGLLQRLRDRRGSGGSCATSPQPAEVVPVPSGPKVKPAR